MHLHTELPRSWQPSTALLALVLVPLVLHGVPLAAAEELAAAVTKMPLAIVNARMFHLEVLSGAVEAVRAAGLTERTVVYIDEFTSRGKDGWRGFVRDYRGMVIRMPLKGDAARVPRHDVVFFISPEKSPGYTRFFVNASRPATVVLLVHNPDAPDVKDLAATLHHDTRLVALSPHVVAALKQRGYNATWWLAAKPYTSKDAKPSNRTAGDGLGSPDGPNAAAIASGPGPDVCMLKNGTVTGPWGFVCQGRIDSRRRGYDALWAAMGKAADAAVGTLGGGPPRLKLLGRPVPGAASSVPQRLRRYVLRVTNAPFRLFYGHILCSHALLPLFADDSYYTVKFSSTVIASLATATPMLVEKRFLDAYSFLGEQTVYLQQPGEELVAAMQRVGAAAVGADGAARRAALAALRSRLNEDAGDFLAELLEAVPRAGTSLG